MCRELLRERGLDRYYWVDSAGTEVGVKGRRPDARAIKVLKQRRVNMGRIRSRPIKCRDFLHCDHILAMDNEVYEKLCSQCPPEALVRVERVGEYLKETGCVDVPDPYFGSEAGFREVMNLLEPALARFVGRLAERQ